MDTTNIDYVDNIGTILWLLINKKTNQYLKFLVGSPCSSLGLLSTTQQKIKQLRISFTNAIDENIDSSIAMVTIQSVAQPLEIILSCSFYAGIVFQAALNVAKVFRQYKSEERIKILNYTPI